MDDIIRFLGWLFLGAIAFSIVLTAIIAVTDAKRRSRTPKIVGTALPVLKDEINLDKRYDITYGSATTAERLTGARILGYRPSSHDECIGAYVGRKWLVVEIIDGRRAYLKPESVLSLVESQDGQS